MTPIILHPTDVLFFRDGRPIGGSLSGHGAAWPMPTVINAALHAALHRAGIRDEVHSHRPGRSGKTSSDDRTRHFGSLQTAGPFPVDPEGNWYFPRPADAVGEEQPVATLFPSPSPGEAMGSLPTPLKYPVVSSRPPSKNAPTKHWLDKSAYEGYLPEPWSTDSVPGSSLADEEFSDSEHYIGIGIDPKTGTQNGVGFYSAQYLRLRDGYGLGILAQGEDKGKSEQPVDLIDRLMEPGRIVVGGQQRNCTSVKGDSGENPLPRGQTLFRNNSSGDDNTPCRVKWTLLSPAVFPAVEDRHSGGWLPNWIDPQSGEVRLLDGPGGKKLERLRRRNPNQRAGQPIKAHLVAALIPKPITITGWALANEDAESQAGAKSTHLAVPAGAVYYFETTNPDEAAKLASVLNWHGEGKATGITNRRSGLFGEKGFGLGVCSNWHPYHKK